MTVRLPPGVRDHLPVEASRRRGLVAALMGELERWGYRPIITPLYEFDDVLARGSAAGAAPALRLVDPASGEILALRPDMTPQVARLAATRLHDEPGPLRLAYEGSVVRMPGARELYQVGVELLDAPQAAGDLEAILLAEAALAAAGVTGVVIDLGHAALARAALDGLGLDEAHEDALHEALQKKNAARVAAAVDVADVPPRRKKLIAALPSLYGGPEVIARARPLLGGAGAAAKDAQRALDELELVIERVRACAPRVPISVDLGEVRGFRYYTGTRFALYAEGASGALVSGGRYDRLVERYGRAARATGFAVDVERVAALLKERGVAAPGAQGGLLMAGEPVLAARLGARLRARPYGARVVLDLDDPVPGDAVLRERAARAQLERVVVVAAQRLRWFDVAEGARGSVAGTAWRRLTTDPEAPVDALLPTR
jgi:ATP phosphoribosyltransferase regulatory subunit